MLAFFRTNTDTNDQLVNIQKTSGDKSGLLHVGPMQEVQIDMPADSPELMFGLNVYSGATISMSATFYVNNIILDLAGQLRGVEHLIIGNGGEATLRQEEGQDSEDITFTSVEVQSGGKLIIESNNEDGMTLIGELVHVHAGGIIEADRVTIEMATLIVDQAGVISASEKVLTLSFVAYKKLDSIKSCGFSRTLLRTETRDSVRAVRVRVTEVWEVRQTPHRLEVCILNNLVV